MVKRRNLDKIAKSEGYEVRIKKRGNHDTYRQGPYSVPVPKSREINDRLAEEIIRQLKGKGRR